MKRKILLIFLFLMLAQVAVAQTLPSVSINVKGGGAEKGDVATTVKIALMMTLLALTPSILSRISRV